ncbi:toxin-antitoxin system YwqK family antitoxin [Vibrio scophthalmi]|uniref:MORN repeat-containing protein n=1 Tax=Vibrio scophthalmi LMG 19158 TaxID=870967 RepID=F9RP78_9VIBR|nr:hypothetical protein [Vibrio scophthalmi]EGU35588.1 hypothetical protein VIS19158_01250 [Vibrio scophthalmi LMG 19158]
MRTATIITITLAFSVISPFAKTTPVWLDMDGEIVASKSEATFYLTEELKQQDGLWPYKFYYVGGTTVASEGTLTGGDIAHSTGIGIFKYYHKNGHLSQMLHRNEKGDVEGTVSYFDESGRLNKQVNYVANKPNGQVIKFGPHGIISESYTIIDNKVHGIAQAWHENGQIQSQTNFVNGLKFGESKTYYESGYLESTINYTDDKPQGCKLEYHDKVDAIKTNTKFDDEGRKISSQQFTIDGELVYDYLATYTGQKVVSDEKKFKNSIVIFKKHINEINNSKIIERFDESGQLHSRSEKFNGKKHKLQVFVNFFHHEVTIENYIHGELNGEYSRIDRNGVVREKGLYLNNNKTGTWEYYFDQTHRIENYNADGKKHGKITTRNNNNLLVLEHYHNGRLHGHSESYSQTGKLSSKGSYVNGERDGLWQYQESSLDNSTLWKGTYKQGKKIGLWNGYLKTDHKIAAETYDAEGLKDGIHYYFFKDSNQISETAQYKHGVRHGTFNSYNKDGKIAYTEVYDNDIKIKAIIHSISNFFVE